MEPVALTDDQINEILRSLPRPTGVGKSAIQIAHRQQQAKLQHLLKTVKLVPVKEAFDKFKKEIIRSMYRSQIEPGTFVGVAAGVALGGPITQLSLNTFHFAGAQSGVAQDFQKVRDFLTGSRMRRDPQMNVFFRMAGTGTDLHDVVHVGDFDSIMAMRPEFEQTTVEDVILNSEILTREEAEQEGVLEVVELHSKLRPGRFIGGTERFPLNSVVKLELNTYRMYSHRITMAMLAEAIEGPAPPDSITAIWRSQFEGLMYIIVDEMKNYGETAISKDKAVVMFLRNKIIRDFGLKIIRGFSGISSIEPQEVDVMRGITRVEASRRRPDIRYVYTDNLKTRWEGVSLGDIHRLLQAAGFEVSPIGNDNKQKLYLKVRYEGDLWKDLQTRVREAQAKAMPERSEQEQAIVKAATFHFMRTRGINMDEIIWRDDIDPYRTLANDPHDIQEGIGIDAARVFLILKFRQTLQEFGSYINARHISLIFDLLTNLGTINSLSFTGVNRRRPGPLAIGSYERPMEVFGNSAIFGDMEKIVGVSPSLYLGQLPKRGGTGSIHLEEDLSAIPQDRPTFPSVDEETILDGDLLDTIESEGSGLIAALSGEKVTPIKVSRGEVDKSRFRQPLKIKEVPPDLPIDILPSGARIVAASETLTKALKKVTAGTNLEVEPAFKIPQRDEPDDIVPTLTEDIPDITTVTDIANLSLVEPSALSPAPAQPLTDIISELKAIPEEGVVIPETISISELPEPSLLKEAPLSPTRPAPLSPTRPAPLSPTRPVPLSPTRPAPEPVKKAKGIITDDPVPPVPPPPEVDIPHPPTLVIEPTPSRALRPTAPSSFVDLIPDIGTIQIPTQQSKVEPISIGAFLQATRKQS